MKDGDYNSSGENQWDWLGGDKWVYTTFIFMKL